MYLSPFTFFALLTVLAFSEINISASYCQNLSNGTPLNASCPLNFDILKKLVHKDPARSTSGGISTRCRNIMEGIDLVRSEYLRTSEFFVLPRDTSEACWESYLLLIGEFIAGFDVGASCGYNAEWISKACMNITSRAQFESLLPSTILYKLRYYCTQSLDNSFTCGLCTKMLSMVRDVYLDGVGDDARNISACSGYPKMYTAAFVNHFGPTDRATVKCLFSIGLGSTKSSRSHHPSVIAGVTAGSVVGLLGALSAVSFLLMKRHRKNIQEKNDTVTDTDETSLVFEFGLCNRSTSLKKFKIKEIKNATKNFSRENIIGMGRYGNVYKGILSDGSEVAIKRLKNCSVVGDANFVHEVEVIASVRHVNLVALRGFCTATVPVEGHQRLIVCDLMHNGSLYDHLFGSGNKKLSWPIRMKIALGYVAPEYALYGKLTEKSDVYSFGAVLLELLSGKKAYENDGENTLRLTDWAWELVEQGRALDVIEQDMPEIGLPEVMEQYVLTAVLCSHPILDIRPTMDQIVKILETDM
ncbi:hypothetical protein V6N13_014580 [Hibiscus sabdariffa]